jgi:hypothetical protein
VNGIHEVTGSIPVSSTNPGLSASLAYPDRLVSGAMPGRSLTPPEVDALVTFIASEPAAR